MEGRWKNLGAITPTSLVEARFQLHYAAQVVSGVGRSWIPREADDSHTSLVWLESFQALAGAGLEGKTPLRVALEVATMRLLLLDADSGELGSFALAGRTLAEAYAWVGGEITARRGDDPGEFAPLHYELPEHPLAAGTPFDANQTMGTAELTRWFSNAHHVLSAVSREQGASPVRCWPHHFDIAVLIGLGGGRSIGVGLSPGDSAYPEPYWYVGPWPHPKPEKWPELPAGKWHTAGFTAAVLTGTELVAHARQEGILGQFLDAAVAGCRTLLESSHQ